MTDSVKELIERLKAAAEKAMSGEWASTGPDQFGDFNIQIDGEGLAIAAVTNGQMWEMGDKFARHAGNAAHIALANPQNITTLCDSYLALAESEAALRERVGELEGDAAKWRTLIASERIRIMGYTHDLKHVGLELWRKHRAKHPCEEFPQDKCRDILEAYVAGETEAPDRQALEAKS